MQIPFRLFVLLLIVALLRCSAFRVEQCKALASSKSPRLSQKSSSEEILKFRKTTLKNYKKLVLIEQDLKQFQERQINFIERDISSLQQLIELERQATISPGNPELLRQALQLTDEQLEASNELMALIKESEKLCPSTEEQK